MRAGGVHNNNGVDRWVTSQAVGLIGAGGPGGWVRMGECSPNSRRWAFPWLAGWPVTALANPGRVRAEWWVVCQNVYARVTRPRACDSPPHFSPNFQSLTARPPRSLLHSQPPQNPPSQYTRNPSATTHNYAARKASTASTRKRKLSYGAPQKGCADRRRYAHHVELQLLHANG